jgi:DNA polymerase-3 subunit chi
LSIGFVPKVVSTFGSDARALFEEGESQIRLDREPLCRLDAAGMTEVLFYHLERQPLDKVLPQLLERSRERGWRVVVQADSDERVEALSMLLWTYSDDSFLAHGTGRDGNAELQPLWLTATSENPNAATVRFFVGGAEPQDYDGLTRAVLLIDGADGEAVERARGIWKDAKASGHQVSYWQQDERGRWQNRAESG